MKKKGLHILWISILSMSIYVSNPPEAQAFRRGTWEDYYGGGITPAGEVCLSSLRTQCITGDIKIYKSMTG